jgi:putative endonuclease
VSDKIKRGAEGENLAAEFLRNKGWEVVAQNYRYGRGEIDLIIRRENWTIFVEVKTRSSSEYGEPEEFVDERKARMIYDAAEEYIFSTNWQGHVRFDIVSIKLGEETEILHFEDAIN